MKKLSVKIILAIALCSTIIASIIGLISINAFSNSLSAKSAANLVMMCEAVSSQMDNKFSLIQKSVENMSLDAGTRFDSDKAKNDINYVNTYFFDLRDFVKRISETNENNLDSYLLLDTIFSKTEFVDELLYIKNSDGNFEYASPLNLISSLKANPENYAWYYDPIKQKKGLWTDVYIDTALNLEMISYVTPIISKDSIVGMAGMDITFNDLKTIVEKNKPYKNSYAFLLNDKNQFIVHPKYKIEDNIYTVENRLYEKLAESFTKNKSGYLQINNDIIGYAKLSNDFKLCVVVPQTEILKEANALKRVLFFLILLGSIVSIIIAAIIGIKIANPIKVLIENMKNIEEGNFNLVIYTNNKDEIGLLYTKFNSMVNSLKTAKEDIETYTKDLENKNKELEIFTYTVSHDLKSPLITIRGFSEIIAEDLEKGRTDRIKSDLRRIESASEKMGELLDDLLMLSRVGRVVNPPERFSMVALTEIIVELLNGSIETKGIKIVIDKQMPNAYGDKQRIQEVLQNLIENSVKFMDKPDGLIEIGYIDKVNEGIYFIRDNGAGISEKYHEKIFGLFDKLDTKAEGTGIGLALVKRIIEFHKGKIWVESSLLNGAIFYFTLGLKE